MHRLRHLARVVLLALLTLSIISCANIAALHKTPGGLAMPLPHYDHIVVVVEENHSYSQLFDNTNAPYLTSLAHQSAVFTDSHGVTHPSQPNYLALFAGSTFGVTSDACPQTLTGPNLATTLAGHGLSFTGYSESLPAAGYMGCATGDTFDPLYVRKHNPWADFANVPPTDNQPLSSFPAAFNQLPTVSFVIPNEHNDMHSGSIATADNWLQRNIGPYAQWASAHNSLLIVTWDEDDNSGANHILTLFAGSHIHAGQYAETIDHYDVLRTIEALEGVSFTNNAAQGSTIADVWQP